MKISSIFKNNNDRQAISVRSGGQSGVDRAALDVARSLGIRTLGWCPKGGWAEDQVEPPGVLKDYPELEETDLQDPKQRTQWNVRDSDASLIFMPKSECISQGSQLTVDTAISLGKPYFVIRYFSDYHDAEKWLKSMKNLKVLNIAGPRASEWPEGYEKSRLILERLLASLIK